jgi:uncharacterized protein
MPDSHYVLVYDYVPDILERRAPHREEHLDLVRRLHDEGIIVMAGATGDPVDSALVVFRSADDRPVRDFVAADPYVAAGLVSAHRILPWTTVVP